MQPGKQRGLARLADEHGVFRMLAIDQRPPVEQLVAERRESDEAPHDDLVQIKRALLDELGPSASAVLLDPLTAFPDGRRVDARQGMLLALEDAVVDDSGTGRRTKYLDDWSVDQIKRAGADGVKLLVWYRPDASPDVLEHQQELVATTGDECARYDIPFVLELLLYHFPSHLGGTAPFHGAQRAELVLESLETFAAPRFGVDVFKVESPYLPEELPPLARDVGFHRAVFDDVDRIVGRPWVLLSGGSDGRSFRRALEYAFAAGASGYLAGRSFWWDSVMLFPDWDRVRRSLREQATAAIWAANALAAAGARPWWARAPHHEVDGPGKQFCRSYERIHPADTAGRPG